MKSKQTKKNKNKIFKLIIIACFLIALFYVGYNTFIKNKEENVFTNVIEVISDTKESTPKTDEIKLLATGDSVLHNDVVNYAQKSDGSYDFTSDLEEVKDIVQKYDIAYYNQETILGGASLGYSFYPTFNGPTEWGDAMLKAGFNTVSLASNHSYDKGENGVLKSLEYWQSTNATINGTAKSEEEREKYPIVTKNNITYAFLSYTYGTNGLDLPTDKSYLVNVYSDELAKKDIEAVKDKVDVIIVAMHWGTEYSTVPTETQKSQAQFLADLGVNIIIGNHPHTLQPIEWLNNKQTLVIYSLGNFISNQGILMNKIGYKGVIGAFVTLDINKTNNTINLNNLNVELLYTYKNTKEKYYKIIPFSKMNETYLDQYKSVYEDYKKIIQSYDATINVLPCN